MGQTAGVRDLGVHGALVDGDVDTVNDHGLVETDSDSDNCDEELAGEHSGGTVDLMRASSVCRPRTSCEGSYEESAATEALNRVEGDRRGEHVDQSEDQRNNERVRNSAGGLEERGGCGKWGQRVKRKDVSVSVQK